MNSTRERAIGALEGLALGDALGMPTQSMSVQWILAEYGKITGLNDAIAQQPIAPNMPAGSVTDDTEQAMLVARLIVENSGHIDPTQLAYKLLDWEDAMRRRGSLDLLGPSTKLALEQVRSGADVKSTGRTGTTNGAAMRVTPVGIANSAEADPDRFAERVYESCRVTHNTVHGFKSAALVAAAVSYGIDGCTVRESLQKALTLIEALDRTIADFGCAWSPKADMTARAYAAVEIAQKTFASEDDFLESIRSNCGTSVESNESIPAAFALAWRYCENPFEALCCAASIGGDTDTIAAICGAMLGASGAAFPQEAIEKVQAVSHLDCETVADALLAERGR